MSRRCPRDGLAQEIFGRPPPHWDRLKALGRAALSGAAKEVVVQPTFLEYAAAYDVHNPARLNSGAEDCV